MKSCPACQTQYTDDTLRFCLQDGTPLDEAPSRPVASVASFDEEETVVSARGQTRHIPAGDERRKLKTPLLIIAAIALVAAVLGLGALGAWIFFKRDHRDASVTSINSINQNSTKPINANAKTSPSPSPSPPIKPNPAVDNQNAKEEVAEVVAFWKAVTESGDSDDLISSYADRVDYYRNRNVGREFIRRDKQRAFSVFDSINLEISNLSVTTDAAAENAVAEFDKEWLFDGERRSEGKVRSQLKMQKINGEWLITGERDLRVYYQR